MQMETVNFSLDEILKFGGFVVAVCASHFGLHRRVDRISANSEAKALATSFEIASLKDTDMKLQRSFETTLKDLKDLVLTIDRKFDKYSEDSSQRERDLTTDISVLKQADHHHSVTIESNLKTIKEELSYIRTRVDGTNTTSSKKDRF